MMDKLPIQERLKTLGEFLPYVAVSRDFIVSKEPSQLTAVLEIRVSELDDDNVIQARHDRLMDVFCDVMSPNSTVSIYLTKRFIHEKLPYRTACDNPLIKYLDDATIDNFNNKLYPHYACFVAITIPVASSKSMGFSKKNDKENIELIDVSDTAENLNNLIHAIKSRIPGSIFRLNSQQILGFLSILINHKLISNYSDLNSILCGDFNASSNGFSKQPGYVYYGGNYHSVMSLRAVGSESRLPSQTMASMNTVFFKSDDMQNIPFTIHQSIKFIQKQEGLTIANLRKNSLDRKKGLAKRSSLFAKTEEGISPDKLYELIEESIEIVENSNNRFVYQTFQVHLWHEELDTLWRNLRTVRNTVSTSYLMKPDKFNIKAAFYSIFPGNEGINQIRSMLATYTVADFFPIDLPRECLPDPDKSRNEHIYFTTAAGSIARLCVFSSLANAHNAMICGGTGSGKSFLMNSILYQSQMAFNPLISIIDVGGEGSGSYRNFVLNNNGTYIEITSENPFSINPFDGPFFQEKEDGKKEPIEIRHEGLLNIITRMVATKEGDDDGSSETLPADVLFHLDEALIKYFLDTNNNENNVCNLHDFAENYLKDNKELISSGVDMYKALAPFIGVGVNTGIYAAYFRKTETIRNPNVVCFDLMGLSSRPKLAAVLIPTLIEMIMRNVSSQETSHRRKLVVVDEAWKFLKGGSIAGFIEQCFATIRKNNGAISILTQNLQTVVESPIAGSLFLNTSYYYLVGGNHVHDPEDNPPRVPLARIEAKSSNGDKKLTNYDIVEILHQRAKRDFYVLSPFFCGKLRFDPTMEFTMLSTTHPQHKTILDKYKKKLNVSYVTPEVLQAAKDEFKEYLRNSSR